MKGRPHEAVDGGTVRASRFLRHMAHTTTTLVGVMAAKEISMKKYLKI